ncbi:hypothetical protein FB451DRAFT_1391020 [Mycena latifolia]|nr:hypothetical protein FB451DRAFT_1391020 [Mycena latifolia]
MESMRRRHVAESKELSVEGLASVCGVQGKRGEERNGRAEQERGGKLGGNLTASLLCRSSARCFRPRALFSIVHPIIPALRRPAGSRSPTPSTHRGSSSPPLQMSLMGCAAARDARPPSAAQPTSTRFRHWSWAPIMGPAIPEDPRSLRSSPRPAARRRRRGELRRSRT